MTKNKKIAEAIRRMKALKLYDDVINDFKDNQRLYYSKIQGILYWVDNNKMFVDLVKNFEKNSNCLVYHCILSHTTMGDMFSMLYISDYKEDWEYDEIDLKDLCPVANVINLADSSLSDMGSIGVKPINGGLMRTA